ncbi:hypothetical protein BH11PSE12_BH11PSE12_08250 [soil metagenome]
MILDGDIKLLKSRVMDDVPEGGGRPTGIAVIDGASNSIFPDISELDRAYGRVNLRKLAVSVNTPDTDGYFGANVILAGVPDDPQVSCTLFTTRDVFDTRVEAQNRLESYVVAGPLSTLRLYGNQLVGQRALLTYQRPEAALPEIGEVYALSVENGSPLIQYVRVTKVDSVIATFSDVYGEFTRRVVTIGISDPLRTSFMGEEPIRNLLDAGNLTIARVRKTSVADSAKYYGTKPLVVAASVGDISAKVSSVFTPLVPSSTQEAPIVMGNIAGRVNIIPAGPPLTLSPSVWPMGTLSPLFMPGVIAPRKLVLSSGSANAYWPKSDNGAGGIVLPNGTTVVGTVDYVNGRIIPDVSKATAWAGALPTVTYTPGAQFGQPAFTDSVDVTLATRGSVYVATLSPIPTLGTTYVDYMALGKWYRLYDDGSGALVGADAGVGSGSVNFVTGGMVVTLGALPDVGSSIIYSWGSAIDQKIRTSEHGNVFSHVILDDVSRITPGSAVITYTKNGVVKTLTDVTTPGLLAGDGETGIVNYNTSPGLRPGEVLPDWYITSGALPSAIRGSVTIFGPRDPGTAININYTNSISSYVNTTTTTAHGGGVFSTNIGVCSPNSVHLAWDVTALVTDSFTGSTSNITASLVANDNGAGVLIADSFWSDGVACGTINYASGAVTINDNITVKIRNEIWTPAVAPSTLKTYGGITINPASSHFGTSVTLKAGRYVPSASPPVKLTSSTPPLSAVMNPGSIEELVLGSLQFTLASASGTSKYVERGSLLYKDPSYATGAAIEVGSIDYRNGRIDLTTWPTGLTTTPLEVQGCVMALSGRTMRNVTYRTAGAPLRVASLYVQAITPSGSILTGSASNTGVISGVGITGVVNVITGVVRVAFGAAVSPAAVNYNAVVQTTLPLDASVVGLDPVRLPADGRVPIFRAGELVVIHHTATRSPSSVSNGQTVNLGRVRLSTIKVTGNDKSIITTGYTTDLDAGTITFTDMAGYSQPVTISNRIEDMALVGDAQINGDLSFTRALTHDFPAPGSLVSSALIIGDMKARVPVMFDQATWSGVWDDTPIGSGSSAAYNDVLAPIVVTNSGALTERWSIQFTNTTAFSLMGEHVGVIAVGNISTDFSPINPATGTPYFTIKAIGWGSGWSIGNILRFNTIGAIFPIWVTRTVQQGIATLTDDSFTILIRGDIDRP